MSAHSAAIPPSSASTGSLIIPNWPTTNAGLALKKINQGLQILEGTGDAWVHQKEHFDRIVQDLRSLIKDKDGIYKSLSDSPLRSVTDPKKRRNAAKFHTDVDQLSATVKRTSAEVLTDADREIEDGIIKASLIEYGETSVAKNWGPSVCYLPNRSSIDPQTSSKMLQELQVYSEEKLLQLQSSISALSLEMESDPTAIDRTIPRPFPLQFSSHSNPATLDAVGSTPAPGPSSPSKYAQREAQRRVFHVRNACTPTTSIADPPPPYFNPDSSPVERTTQMRAHMHSLLVQPPKCVVAAVSQKPPTSLPTGIQGMSSFLKSTPSLIGSGFRDSVMSCSSYVTAPSTPVPGSQESLENIPSEC